MAITLFDAFQICQLLSPTARFASLANSPTCQFSAKKENSCAWIFFIVLHPQLQLYIISSVLLYAMPMFIESYTLNIKLYILPYMLPIIHMALLGSIYSTVALAAERYITICHPFVRYR